MLTISAVKLNTYNRVSFGETQQKNNQNSKVGVMSIDKNAPESIHMCDFPSYKEELSFPELEPSIMVRIKYTQGVTRNKKR